MVLYAGIDLHSTNSVVVVIDETDKVVRRGRLKNRLETVAEWLEPYRDALAGVVVESTYNWYWLVDGLKDRGYTMHLANTVAIRQYVIRSMTPPRPIHRNGMSSGWISRDIRADPEIHASSHRLLTANHSSLR